MAERISAEAWVADKLASVTALSGAVHPVVQRGAALPAAIYRVIGAEVEPTFHGSLPASKTVQIEIRAATYADILTLYEAVHTALSDEGRFLATTSANDEADIADRSRPLAYARTWIVEIAE